MLQQSDLDGTWKSPSPENLGQMYGTREFHLRGDAWSLRFDAYADEQAQVPLFTLDVEGTYGLGPKDSSAAGAQQADFRFAKRYVTVHHEGAAGMFGDAARLGEQVDVSERGAGFIPSVSDAPVEFDLLRLDGADLFFGDRSGDLSKTRPAALFPYPVRRA